MTTGVSSFAQPVVRQTSRRSLIRVSVHREYGMPISYSRTSKYPACSQLLAMNRNSADESSSPPPPASSTSSSPAITLALFAISFLYWYLLVFGAAASSANLPVPDFIPLVPGWPPSDADLAPALEDSAHFFYIRDLIDIQKSSMDPNAAVMQELPVVRLAVFNFAEAWVFAFFPALLADRKRLALPVLLFTWTGALGLTNAFLAPYLAFRELFASFKDGSSGEVQEAKAETGGRNAILAAGVGAIATAVVAYAGASCLTEARANDWSDFARLATEDRTYLAFCIDLILFSIFQPFLLGKIYEHENEEDGEPMPQIYNVPFVGLMAWLFGV